MESLVRLCLNTVIDNLDYLGCVGDLDEEFVKIILSHCNLHQLRQIEDANSDRDLSALTDGLWHGFFLRKYGSDLTDTITEKMKNRKSMIPWRKIYYAKLKEEEKTQDKCVERLKELYQEASQQRQTRQTLVCSKLPPGASKRKPFQSSSPSNYKNGSSGQLMKKARIAYANSLERKIRDQSNNRRHSFNFSSNSIKTNSESRSTSYPNQLRNQNTRISTQSNISRPSSSPSSISTSTSSSQQEFRTPFSQFFSRSSAKPSGQTGSRQR